ncbi:arsenate reductase [Flavobacterium sp. AS60]|uniref:ArsC/Spx/MgsR family protein n=1 Tax=Flavobacterium anseongense TaxID=2910677 RepID=UPI001F37FE45|nr:ArsC/Spx/MgsR family protein [Flavobacterium sp. AS60]MCF6129439.1 arsenate reductase [Flavobacterium sp. AS60]
MLQILHNPRCGKSRNCLAFVTETNTAFEIINYLENTLSVNELKALIKKLKIKPIELVRQKETIWIENYKGKSLTDTAIIKALAKHPILIERPIVINGDKAIIGREIDKLENFLK